MAKKLPHKKKRGAKKVSKRKVKKASKRMSLLASVERIILLGEKIMAMNEGEILEAEARLHRESVALQDAFGVLQGVITKLENDKKRNAEEKAENDRVREELERRTHELEDQCIAHQNARQQTIQSRQAHHESAVPALKNIIARLRELADLPPEEDVAKKNA